MVERTWPALQSCKHQCSEANDLLSQLPDDLLLFIMSFLTMKEAARTSILSHRWNYLWRCFPVLIFEDISAMERMFEDDDFVPQERSRFLRWVNRVVEAHLGQYVDELRVTFDLNKRCQSDLNKWLVFALAKQVKRLELNFTTPTGCYKSSLPRWRMPLDQPHNLSVFKSSLRSLSLICVNVTTNDIDCLLSSCMVLENLCINDSRPLKYIRAYGLPLQLKHLEVSYCPCLKTIDILAPKLLSFTHHGNPVELHIRNASLLSKLSLGDIRCTRDIVACAFDSLSKYFSQLEYLSWTIELFNGSSISLIFCVQFNLGIKNPPVMTNLKHLELHVTAFCEQSLLGWADLIEASPLLERLTLKFSALHGRHCRKIMKRNGRPLKSLKTLELYNDLGLPIDLEFATYVVDNSVMLKDVIVELKPLFGELSEHVSVQDQAAKLKSIVPQGVKLTLKIVDMCRENMGSP